MIKVNKKAKILVTYNTNWADEMNIQAAILVTVERWNKICEEAKLAFTKYKTCTHYVGTNQEIKYNSYEQWLDCYRVRDLSDTEYEVLEKFEYLLNSYKFFIPEYYEEDSDKDI
jgi:hypothetical protein